MYVSFSITRDASRVATRVLKSKKCILKDMEDLQTNLEVGWGLLLVCSLLLNTLLAYHFKGSW